MDECKLTEQDAPPDWRTVEDCLNLYSSIKGIRQQALVDMLEIISQNQEIVPVLVYFDLVIFQTMIISLWFSKNFYYYFVYIIFRWKYC